jgi:predicted amidohydrolase
VFSFRAEKVMDIHGRFFVEDVNGQLIGMFKKEFKQSLFNSTWSILGADEQPKLTIKESNELLAVARRFAGMIPVAGDLFEIILVFIKYHFTVIDPAGKQYGMYRKTTLFRDHYQLTATDELFEFVDWRVVASLAVALDALQSR